jgi:hypothetical protein
MDDVDVLAVPRLAKGSHHRYAGKMCAMNLLSRERGDWLITDYPAGTSPALARFCQHLNDRVCVHGTVEDDLLCPSCSTGVIDVAHATVGTDGGSAELSWRWAGAVADLAADEMVCDFSWVVAARRRTAWSCRDIARQIAETPRAAFGVSTESKAAGQSASASLGAVIAQSGPGRALGFAVEAVAVWHELAGSVPRVVDPVVQAAAWVAARAEAGREGMFAGSLGDVGVPGPVWLPSVQSASLVLAI